MGDGLADDTMAIRTAIHTWANLGYGRLNIPAGDYRITETISVQPSDHRTRSMTLIGYGAHLFYSGTGVCLDFNNDGGKEFRDLTIQGLGFNGQRETASLRLRNPETGGGNFYRWKLVDLVINRSAGHGIEIEGNTFEGILDNCRVWSRTDNVSHYGIYIHASQGGKISSLDLINCNTRGFKRGVFITPAADIDIFGGTFLLAQEAGIRANIQGGTMTGVHAENNWQGAANQAAGGGGVHFIGWGVLSGIRAGPENKQKYGVHIFANAHPVVVLGHGHSGAGGTFLLADGSANSKITTVGILPAEITVAGGSPVTVTST